MSDNAGIGNDYFHAVYMRNIRQVYRVCYLRLGNREDAEDAAQNIFIRWYKRGTPFETEEHEKAYFLKAACNEAKNVLKNFWRNHRVDYDDVPESMMAETDPHPEVEDIFSLLEPKYREVLVLFYVEGLTSAEIAKLLSRNENTVRTQLRTGRDRLRSILEKETNI